MVENQIKNYFYFFIYIGVTSDDTSNKIVQLLSTKYMIYRIKKMILIIYWYH